MNYLAEEPMRVELFSSDQMERFGKTLAKKHVLSNRPSRDHLLKRLAENEAVLQQIHRLITGAIKSDYQLTPAGEWLIDNFYLVEEHIRIAKTHFPKHYSEDLPQVIKGNANGVTRSYDIALQVISHNDGRMDIENLSLFVGAYQSVTTLKLGELWSIPIMLRLALIENIRRVSVRIANDRMERNLANGWAVKMIETAESAPKNIVIALADMARSNPPIKSAFVAELIRLLRGKGPDLALVLNWLEQQLSGSGLTGDELVNAENQKQAADQVSMSNSIGSLRILASIDWKQFVEQQSAVEKLLLQDNDGIYGKMDFDTRDQYRHVVERIARKSKKSEAEIARIAIELMWENADNAKEDPRMAHVGFYLVGPGLKLTEQRAGIHFSVAEKLQRYCITHALFCYLSGIALVTIAISAAIILRAFYESKELWVLISVSILALVSAGQLAMSVVNFLASLWVKPDLLPRMDYSGAIPSDCATLIVVPTLLTGMHEAEQIIESLEVRFLANRTENLYFGLLTDFADATQQTSENDRVLLEVVQQGIEALNKKYRDSNGGIFFLFHRPRKWNPGENVWMGYERKRGKIADLNKVLIENATENFSLIIGDRSVFPAIKYVITLDADTKLPLNTAWKLVATIAHPLNRAWYDAAKGRVTRGYGILQPRITVSLPDETSSRYRKMHGNEPGVDPYTRASSDVYQDLFGEGSYIGKGIYDVDIFHKVLRDTFPANRILSHDLLEGCYLRSGLVSDVQLFEKYPPNYLADMKVRLRWLRGDWQILPWLWHRVPGSENTYNNNPISSLSKWKVFDNIRRSFVPLAHTLFLLLAWMVFHSVLFWTILVSVLIIFPIIITTLWDICRKPKNVLLRYHIKSSYQNLREVTVRTGFTLICLPYEAFANMWNILRTLWRMYISKKYLLEWETSAKSARKSNAEFPNTYAAMWIEPCITIAVFIWLSFYAPGKLFIAGPILMLWIFAPFIAWLTGKPEIKPASVLSPTQSDFLQRLARRIWNFFEQFVVAGDNWLPPDNFQEQPVEQIAHRTSPTNIGLSLLAGVTAAEFGYITTAKFLERTANTLNTMGKLERYNGHFYNWYDTQSLQPLYPRYVSTVDSGNLAGHLLVLKQGLLAVPHQPAGSIQLFSGIRDTLGVLMEALLELKMPLPDSFYQNLNALCNAQHSSIIDVYKHYRQLEGDLRHFLDQVQVEPNGEIWRWKQILLVGLEEVNNHFSIVKPWLLLQAADEKLPAEHIPDMQTSWYALRGGLIALRSEIQTRNNGESGAIEIKGYANLLSALNENIAFVERLITTSEQLAQQCSAFADMQWDFLFDKPSHLFSIGYNVQDHRPDPSYYDLLASEVRLSIFVCIAQGKLPEESWFALGRLLTRLEGSFILLSWSGSMFEYLMPLLVMPTYENTLLDETYKSAVNWQIKYGRKTGRPWGISESGYNMLNAASNYQYRAFGAPGLGLKRGLEEDAVIAPYASVMALMVEPAKACANLELLRKLGIAGKYGFYEAVDYTPSRLPHGQTKAIVYSFMTHHQGMSLLALAYVLSGKPMQKLFEAEPQFKATLLLLQERIPKATATFAHTTSLDDINYKASAQETRILNTAFTPIPEIQLLSNGRYHLMVSNAGGGYSRWKDIAVTRWYDDVTCDNRGTFCYICDVETNAVWSNTLQPTLEKTLKYEVAYSQGRVDFHTMHHAIDVHTEIVVSPEDDIELRRLHITHSSDRSRTIELTSYAEVVLAPASSDLMAPAFSNLFVQTRIVPEQNAIVCTRRPRSADEQVPWMFHLMVADGREPEEISFETDRMAFIGHGNTIVNPRAMHPGKLGNSQGSVLDPIVAVRYRITVPPQETVIIDMVTGVADTETGCYNLINKYFDNKSHKDRVFELAWSHSQVVLHHINASEREAQLFSRLAGSILYPNALFRADPFVLINNHRQQSGLWGYVISGDLPIVLLQVESPENIALVHDMIQAHAYWRMKGLTTDLVIWNETHYGYRQSFQSDIEALVPPELLGKKGGIFIMASDHIPNEDRILFQSVARVIISDSNGSLADHINKKEIVKAPKPRLAQGRQPPPVKGELPLPAGLLFFNGMGGFSPDGKEYIILSNAENRTPVPWVNVIANAGFGTVISECGSAYTWTENAHELRLSTWSNDPVSDTGGEAFYIRDEENGNFWSPSLLPAGGNASYITRHGFGYSVFEHIENGIYTEMTVFVDIKSAVKFTCIKVRNHSGRHRKLSATGYVEWVLGDNRTKTAMHIHTEIDPDSKALFAKNQYSTEFNNRVAFFDVDYQNKFYTGDRTEFLGRNGNLKMPDALTRTQLAGRTGLALDPCGAIQVPFDLEDGEDRDIIFRLGAGKDEMEASALSKEFRGNEKALEALEKVKAYWFNTMQALRVETPDMAVNIITNGWLTYQTLSSRLWGRSGFYQSGGAFGFRDQLQDVMSLLYARPALAREQILLAASRQFKEGDVQHWWHPPSGRGVRTRISDDFLWLPYVTNYYIKHTGDTSILDVSIDFLDGRQLNPDEESYYDLPLLAHKPATLYAHCVRAIKRGLNFGEHGLPLIGTGDWNDGFDKVGNAGKGESVWLAFFLCDILIAFAHTAELYGDKTMVELCNREAAQLKININETAWDGEWYKRAWFDNGTALGSKTNTECTIDSISQSWAVLSGCADDHRGMQAMDSAYAHLVDRESGVIKLLTPAFDTSELDPGYIKGYVPGVRENGGQYTHAAVWMIMAFARLKNNERVWELLQMINPVNHGKTQAGAATYKVEPYVLAADVYAEEPHTGRGGWTWYTGSAAWLYRLITESFLGIFRKGNALYINPCVPDEWQSYSVHCKFENADLAIEMKKINGDWKMFLNGEEQQDTVIVLPDPGNSTRDDDTDTGKEK